MTIETASLILIVVLFLIAAMTRWVVVATALNDLAALSRVAEETPPGELPDAPNPFRGELYASVGVAHLVAVAAFASVAGLQLTGAGPVTFGVAVAAVAFAWVGLRAAMWFESQEFELRFGMSPREMADSYWGPGSGASWPVPLPR